MRDMVTMFEKAVEYCRENSLQIPNVNIPILLPNEFDSFVNMEDMKFPFLSFYSELNKPYPLIPDNTFGCYGFKKNFGDICFDWDQGKEYIKDSLVSLQSDKLYFKGEDTTPITNLRQIFVDEQIPEDMDLSIEKEDDLYEPIYTLGKNKYLLDLPIRNNINTNYSRFFLTERLVVRYTNTIDKLKQEESIYFTDLFTRSGKHYIKFTDKLSEKKEENIPVIKESIQKISESIHNLNNDTSKYSEIQIAGTNLMNILKSKHIHHYVYIVIKKYAEFLSNVEVKQSLV